MPTYTNPNDTNFLEAGVYIAAGETKSTPLTLTETVVTLPSAVSGLGLELVTEATSGSTGRIFWIDGATIGLVELSAAFTGELALTADVTGALGTPASGATVVQLTRDTATDFYSALLARQTITASGIGSEDVYLHRGCTWIAIAMQDVAVTIKNGASGDILYFLNAGVWLDRNDQRYQHLILDFPSAGSCEVFEFDSDYNPLAFSDFGNTGTSLGGTVDSSLNAVNTINLTAPQTTQVDSTSFITASHTLTGTFAKVGTSINTYGKRYCSILLSVDINDSLDVRLQVVRLTATDATVEPVMNPAKWDVRTSTLDSTDEEYRELDRDTDDVYVIDIELDNVTPAIALYAMAGTVGATPGVLDVAEYVTGY